MREAEIFRSFLLRETAKGNESRKPVRHQIVFQGSGEPARNALARQMLLTRIVCPFGDNENVGNIPNRSRL